MVYKKKAEKRIRIPENLKTPFSQMSRRGLPSSDR